MVHTEQASKRRYLIGERNKNERKIHRWLVNSDNNNNSNSNNNNNNNNNSNNNKH